MFLTLKAINKGYFVYLNLSIHSQLLDFNYNTNKMIVKIIKEK